MASFATGCKGHVFSCDRTSCRRRVKVSCSNGSKDTSSRRLPVVILPGFLSNNTTAPDSQYRELQQNLLQLGHPEAEILPATRWDWFPNLSGGSFKWYVARMAEAVQRLQQRYDSQVNLVGISAGGWLARLGLGSVPYDGEVWGLSSRVHTLVTCGTPHKSLEAYPFGRAEEAWIRDTDAESTIPAGIRTSLQFTNYFYQDADSIKPTRLVCVIGSAVKGQQFAWSELGQQVLTGQLKPGDANAQWFTQSAYMASCGRADVDGDGVCPVESGVVPGAETLVLPGVWHNAAPGKRWYGSMDAVQQWDKFLP